MPSLILGISKSNTLKLNCQNQFQNKNVNKWKNNFFLRKISFEINDIDYLSLVKTWLPCFLSENWGACGEVCNMTYNPDVKSEIQADKT